jgi:signal peptidase I
MEGRVLINGVPLSDDVNDDIILSAGLASDPVTLGEGEYFVLGDNRNNSEDSRFSDIGNISADNIIGRPWVIVSPLNQFRMIGRQYRVPLTDEEE